MITERRRRAAGKKLSSFLPGTGNILSQTCFPFLFEQIHCRNPRLRHIQTSRREHRGNNRVRYIKQCQPEMLHAEPFMVETAGQVPGSVHGPAVFS